MSQFRGYSLFVIAASFFLNFLTDGVRLSVGLLFIEFLEYFSAGEGGTAAIGSILFAVVHFTAPISSMAITRFGCRKVTMFAGLLSFLGVFVSQFASSIYFLYASLGIVTGLGFSVMTISRSITIIEHFKDNRVMVFGISSCGIGTGGIVFSIILNYLISLYTWRGALLIMSAITLNACVASALMGPPRQTNASRDHAKMAAEPETYISKTNTKINSSDCSLHTKEVVESIALCDTSNVTADIQEDENAETIDTNTEFSALKADTISKGSANLSDNFMNVDNKEIDNIIGDKPDVDTIENGQAGIAQAEKETLLDAFNQRDTSKANTSKKRQLFNWSLLRKPRILLLMMSRDFFSIGFMAFVMYLPERSVSMGYSKKESAVLTSGMSAAIVVLQLVTGFIGQYVKGTILHNGAVFIMAGAVLAAGFSSNYILLMLESVLVGGSLGTILALYTEVLTVILPISLVPDALSLTIFAQGPGILIGPPIAGWVVNATGSSGPAFIIGGICLFISAVLCVLAFRERTNSAVVKKT